MTTAWTPLSDPEARAAYASLLSASDQGSPFSSLPFAEAACAAFGLEGGLLLVRDNSGEAQGGLITFEKRRGPVRALALPPYGEFVTPILRAPLAANAVHRGDSPLDALSAGIQARVQQAALRLHPSLHDARPLGWSGWILTPAYHAEAAIQGESGMESWGRYPRKSARKHASSYTLQEGRAHIGAVVRLAEQSLAAKGLGHPNSGAVIELATALVDAGQAQAFVALSADGVAEAGIVAAWGGDTGYYWIVGSSPGPSMTVLVAHLCRWLHTRGVSRLHFGGANIPGVAEFKRGFGAELVPVLRARWIGPRWLRALDLLRSR